MQFDFKSFSPGLSQFSIEHMIDSDAYKGNIFHRSYHFIDFISNIIIFVFLNWRLLACKGIFADRIIVIYFNFEV